jgi:alkylation response protein AidB-like acyl-CoA dehydrogenase
MIRPIIEMTGAHTFNEVFFDQARRPGDSLVGQEGAGWALAKVTLGNERVSLSSGGALWGMGPAAGDLLDLHVWREEGAVGFRVTNDAGREVVSCGYAVFRKGHGA